MSNNIEISVGLPFLKCSSNPSQTINKKTGRKSKTILTKKLLEENIDRIGKDPDIDLSLTYKNKFLTEINSTEEYLAEINFTKKRINEKLQENNCKQLRKDTVDNISLIVKPNFDSISLFNEIKQEKFLTDSKTVIENIFKQINPNFKFSVAVIHFDELSPHLHLNFMPLILDEKKQIETFNAKQFLSLKNITLLNKNYSKEMQKLGWKVKDFRIYDEMTNEQKEKYKTEKKNYGKSSLEYKTDKLKELDDKINNRSFIKAELEKKLEDDVRKNLQQKLYDDSIKMINDIKDDIVKEELEKEETKEKINIEVQKKIEKEYQKVVQKYDYDSTLQHYKKYENWYKEEYKYSTMLEKKFNILEKTLNFVINLLPNKLIKNKLFKLFNLDDVEKYNDISDIENEIVDYLNENEETNENNV